MDKTAPGDEAPETFTYAQLETALCTWEWLLEQVGTSPEPRKLAQMTPNDLMSATKLNEIWGKIGACAMRHSTKFAADIVLQVHRHMKSCGYEFDGPYDWEFVPAVLHMLDWDALISFSQYGTAEHNPPPAYTPDAADIWERIFPDIEGFLVEADPHAVWVAKARRAADKLFTYPNLVNDLRERFDEAFQAGEDPEKFTEQLGDKYGLIRRETWGLN